MFSKLFNTDKASTTPANETSKGLSDPNPAVDTNGKAVGTDQTPINPLDAYKTMYENANKGSDIAAPSFKLDPKVLGDVSKSMDFTKGIDPALMEKALAGDAKSLLAVINASGQAAYSASLEHATTLTETHLGQRADYESKLLNKGVKTQLTSDALSSAPNYDHPVVKAELNRVADMYSKANPDATPQQVAKAAQKHLQDLSAALSPAKAADAEASEGMDWSKYLDK
jgi:hypothetical protein